MNPFEKLLEALSKLGGRIDGVGDSLPADAEIEQGSPLAYGKRAIAACARELKETIAEMTSLANQGKELATKSDGISDEIRDQIRKELIEAGELVSKADAEAAAGAAADEREKTVRETLEAEAAEVAAIDERRGKLSEDVPAEVRAEIPAEVLAADQFEANSAKIAARFKRLKELNIAADSVLKEVASLKIDAEGDAAFDRKVKQIEEIVGASRQSGSGPGKTRNPGANFGAGGEKPAVMI